MNINVTVTSPKIQWLGVIISYTLLISSMYLLFKKILELAGNSGRGIFKELSVFMGVIPSTFFILISDGYWYHSIVLSISFMILEFYLAIKYIYEKPDKKISHSYFTIISI